MCCSCPDILRDVPRAYNAPCLLVSAVTFRQTWQRAEQSNICSCIYILVVTQWFIIIQVLLSSPLPGHTLITPFAVGQTQACCGQLIKYSPLQIWLSIRSFLKWRSTPKIGDGHLTFNGASLQSAYKPLTPWKNKEHHQIIQTHTFISGFHVNFSWAYFWGWWVHPQAPMLHTTRYCSPSRSTSFSTRRRLAGGPAEDAGGEISWEHATYIFLILHVCNQPVSWNIMKSIDILLTNFVKD